LTKINKPFYYEKIAKEITNYILDDLELGIKEDQYQFEWPYKDIKLYNNEEYINFYFGIERIKSEDWQGEDIYASAGVDMCDFPSVEIYFKFKERSWIKNHQYRYEQIMTVVSHELHHLTQEIKEDTFNPSTDTVFKYFMNQYEAEAFFIGFTAESDYTGREREDCMRDFLNNFNKSGAISLEEVEKIIVKWNEAGVKLVKGVNNES